MKADVKALRAYFQSQVTALNALIDTLTDPLKSQYSALRDQFNQLLSGLPPLEQHAAAEEINFGLDVLVGCIERANEVIAGLQAMLRQKQQESDTQAQALQSRIAQFEARLKNGELLEKAVHQELLSAATAKASQEAAAEAEKKVRAEFEATAARAKLIADRKAAVASAGLPVPAEELLSAAEETFNAAKTKAQGRVDALKAKGLPGTNGLVVRMAWCSEAEYAELAGLVDEALKVRGQRAEPFAVPAGSNSPAAGGVF
jgi:DNA repair exonuclease SbcCD ATPase subunit